MSDPVKMARLCEHGDIREHYLTHERTWMCPGGKIVPSVEELIDSVLRAELPPGYPVTLAARIVGALRRETWLPEQWEDE